MFWTIINILIAVYIIYSLQVTGREIAKVSNDEIERELKDI